MIRLTILLTTVLFAMPVALAAQEKQPDPKKSAAEKDYGKRVGDQAPNFSLVDHQGNKQSLETLLEDGPVAVVFFRSADW